MEVLFNEFCLNEGQEFPAILSHLVNAVDNFENSDIRLSTDIVAFKNWLTVWSELIPTQQQARFYKVMDRIQSLATKPILHYYHYYSQNQLSITNYPASSIAAATDKLLSGHHTAILNLPDSRFCARPHIPILRAPFDSSAAEELAIIPSWSDSRLAIAALLVDSKMLAMSNNNTEFDEFKANYRTFLKQFDINNWEPKTYIQPNKLASINAFPASSQPELKQYFNSLRRHANGSIEENITTYKIIGGLVLKLNGYEFNAALTQHYRDYHIYEGGYENKKLLISIDNENGAFEVLESDGTHIGVYGYDGEYKRHYTEIKDIQSHSLKNVPQHMLKYRP